MWYYLFLLLGTADDNLLLNQNMQDNENRYCYMCFVYFDVYLLNINTEFVN
jgi:hypothetical protein